MKDFNINDTQIIEAIEKAELTTGAEIVPVLVEQSDSYELARYKQSISIALLSLLPGYYIQSMLPDWHIITSVFPMAMAVTAAIISYSLCSFWGVCKKFFLSDAELYEKTLLKARLSFLDNEIFATRSRNGILIYFSFFEQRIHIIADIGLSEIPDSEWQIITDNISKDIKSGNITIAIVKAIERSAELLKSFALVQKKKTNKLKDNLRKK